MIQLDNNYFLNIEKYNDRLRLIIFEFEKELACRKENKNTLLNFLDSENTRIFKGRIQLESNKEIIVVYLKDYIIGSLPKKKFIELINNMD